MQRSNRVHNYGASVLERKPSDLGNEGSRKKRFQSKLWLCQRLCSIGVLMPVLLVSQIIVTVLIVWGLGFFNTLTSIGDLTVQLEMEIASRINDTNVNSLLLPSKAIAALRSDGLSEFWKPDNLRQSIWNHFNTFHEISLLYIGIEDEFYSGFERFDNGTVVEWAREAGNEPPALIYQIDRTSPTAERRSGWGPVTVRPYNTTLRPWYQGAMADHPTLHWTDVYPFAADLLGITLAGTVKFGDNVVGVAAMDFTLSAISGILDAVQLTPNGLAFIAKKSGELLASSVSDDIQDAVENLVLIPAVNSSVETIAFVSQEIDAHHGGFDKIVSDSKPRNSLTIARGLERLYVIASDFNFDKSIDWVIFVVIPESDIMENVYISTGIIAGVTLGVVAFSIMLAILFTIAITRPLHSLQRHMENISSLDFTQSTPRTLGLFEIKSIESTFNGMVYALRSFRKFVPDAVIKAAVQTAKEVDISLHNAYLSIFFLDLADFTHLSEVMPPDQLVLVVGEAMEALSKIVSEEGATIDKYIGDCIMALFNVPESVKNHEIAACRAALRCQAKLKELHPSWRQRGLPALTARIGIHCGEALVGNFGSSTRLNYTAIGDNVNLAARLEPLNKLYKTETLISNEMYDAVKDQIICRFVDRCMVKGRSGPTSLYEILCVRKETDRSGKVPTFLKLEENMNRVADLWFNNQIDEALALIEECQTLCGYGNDYALRILEERFRRYRADPSSYVQTIELLDKDF